MEFVLVLLVLLLSSYCEFTDAECLEISPARVVVKHGDPASANCTPERPQPMGWEATEGGLSLSDTELPFMLWTVNRLTEWLIKPVCFTDGGKCQKTLNITVYKLPTKVSMSGLPDQMFEGRQYEFKCHVQEVAPVNSLYVSFYKASTYLIKTEIGSHPPQIMNTTKEPTSGEYTLQFTPSRGDHEAQLWCSARLELGEEGPQPSPKKESEHLTLNVLYKPNISVTPEGSSEIKEGDNLSLRCQAEGNPTPSYRWVVPQAGPTSITRAEGSVVNVTHIARSQAGNYTCIATNEVGNSTWTVDVKVTELPTKVSMSGLPDQMVEGRQYEFKCHVQEVAPVNSLYVSFYKASANLIKTEIGSHPPQIMNTTKEPTSGEYTLQFTPSRGDHGAQLWCSARLELGKRGPQPSSKKESEHLTLKVLYKPNISVTPEGSSEIKEGDNLSLRCQAEGNPTPSYRWVVPQAGPTSITRAEGSVVNVTHIARSQAGNYTCIATNEVGNSTWTVDVKVTVTYLHIIVGLVFAGVVILTMFFGSFYLYNYKHNRTGSYQLKNMLPRQRQKKPFEP
ncbi:intercellular adhesion molecule 3-like [Esox lucius]|uniref:Ig-like domain-containing protein n=2 Tax=Esox lucius TaxID=8010 RepID=A0A3P8Z087_ESOLU|nr:intercellular adhesion molecule 3-like [Esox lucius]